MTKFATLNMLAERHGYRIDIVRSVRRRGWPTPSARPYHLSFADGCFIAAFADLDGLERNLRNRAGC